MEEKRRTELPLHKQTIYPTYGGEIQIASVGSVGFKMVEFNETKKERNGRTRVSGGRIDQL